MNYYKMILFILAILCSGVLHADNISMADKYLKNYGFSYCLKTTDYLNLSSEPAKAMGGYFQEGFHNEPAYKNTRYFIDSQLSKIATLQTQKGLEECLAIYHNPSYDNMIYQQRVYL